MARSFKTQLSGQIGEHLVVAELGRLGVVATPFAGNVPDIDVLAYANGKSVPIQVKAQKTGNPGVNAKKYLNIKIDGDRQTVIGKTKDIDRELIFVLVKVGKQSGEYWLRTKTTSKTSVHTTGISSSKICTDTKTSFNYCKT